MPPLGRAIRATGLLPPAVELLLLCAAGLIPLLLFFLLWEKRGQNRKRLTRLVGTVLLALLCLAETAGLAFAQTARHVLNDVTGADSQISVVGVYVRQEDPAQSLAQALEAGYRFGTIAGADPQTVAIARSSMEDSCGREMAVTEYPSLLALMQALDTDEVDALLIPEAYRGLIESLPDYASYAESLRLLGSHEVASALPGALPEPDTDGTLRDPRLWEDSFCVYLSGIDTYGPVTAVSRSDVNILAIVNRETMTVLLVSTPRDFYVPFPVLNGERDKLTHAGVYGIDASMQTLGDFYGLPIACFLRVNFSGFARIIDALGGVEVESDAEFSAQGFHFTEGTNQLNGEAALAFARERHAFRENDRARGRHQMAVIRGVIRGLRSSRLLANYGEVLEQLSGSFQTDAPPELLGELVQKTLRGGDWTVLSYSVDGEGESNYAPSLGAYAYVMRPYDDTVDYARTLMQAVAAGDSLSQDWIQANAPRH